MPSQSSKTGPCPPISGVEVSAQETPMPGSAPASGPRGTKGARSPFYVAKVERPLDLAPWPSRRRSDYFTGLLMVNSFIGLVMLYGRDQPLILFFGGAGMVVWTLGLTWIVWVVMDRY